MEMREIINFKNKMETLAAIEKKKHKQRKQIFDEKDFNIMFQMQQAQKDLNKLVTTQKMAQTENFLKENEKINERISVLESN
jgi:hypothetical protein